MRGSADRPIGGRAGRAGRRSQEEIVSHDLGPDRPARWLRVDHSGNVAGVSPLWNELVSTSFVGCLAPATLGERFSTVGGAAASIYAHLFAEARRLRPVSLDIWAAGPETSTKLELTIRRAERDVELGLEPLFERSRPLRQPFYDPAAARGDDAIRACGFCQRLDSFRWTDPELALVQLRVDPHAFLQPRLKPDVCLDCDLQLRRGLRAAS
jgi:hypothetical protein